LTVCTWITKFTTTKHSSNRRSTRRRPLKQMNEIQDIIVREAYKDYQPYIKVRKVVERLVAAVPAKHLCGIKTVLLTNSGNLNHDQRRGKTWSRRKNVQIRECFGLYHRKTAQSEAWIEIFVDNILAAWPRPLHYIHFLCDLFFATTLYHEIGHHIHTTQRPEHKESEDVADEWQNKLSRPYFRRRYWYLIWIVKAIRKTGKMLRKRKANHTSEGIRQSATGRRNPQCEL